MFLKQLFLIILTFCIPVANSYGQLNHWPKDTSPEEVGLRIAERFIASPHGVYNSPGTKPHIPLFELCTWYGSLTFADLPSNKYVRT